MPKRTFAKFIIFIKFLGGAETWKQNLKLKLNIKVKPS